MVKIEDLSKPELENIINNYRKKNLIEGGRFSLSEALLEQRRRHPSDLDPKAVAKFIAEKCKSSDDGFVTYNDIWSEFNNGKPWSGHSSLKVVSDALYKIIYLCIENDWPLITTVVVRETNRKLSESAKIRIFEEARDLGVNVGINVDSFINEQMRRARSFIFK